MNIQKSLLDNIIDFIFGNKYYANIIATRGTDRHEISSFIFHSEDEAYEHRKRLRANRSFLWVETVSFRSHNKY